MPNIFTHLTLELRNLLEVSGISAKTVSVLTGEHLKQPVGNERIGMKKRKVPGGSLNSKVCTYFSGRATALCCYNATQGLGARGVGQNLIQFLAIRVLS